MSGQNMGQSPFVVINTKIQKHIRYKDTYIPKLQKYTDHYDKKTPLQPLQLPPRAHLPLPSFNNSSVGQKRTNLQKLPKLGFYITHCNCDAIYDECSGGAFYNCQICLQPPRGLDASALESPTPSSLLPAPLRRALEV